MRFKITKKEKEEKVLMGRKGPNPGDEMKWVRFARLPTIVEGHRIWLETYIETRVYREVFNFAPQLRTKPKSVIGWVLTEPKLTNNNSKTIFRNIRKFLEV